MEEPIVIDVLHTVQHRFGYLEKDALRELARQQEAIGKQRDPNFRMALARYHEVASFFPHFRFTPPPPVEVKICRDYTCHLRGAARLSLEAGRVAAELGSERVKICGVSCLGLCDKPVAASISVFDSSAVDRHEEPFKEYYLPDQNAEKLGKHIRNAEAGRPLNAPKPDSAPLGWQIDCYGGNPGYEVVRRMTAPGQDNPLDGAAVLKTLEDARLVGKGGPGEGTAKKWKNVLRTIKEAPVKPRTAYVVCNGDESEPGTFKDRELLLRAPHLVVEGVIIAGLSLGASRGFIYIRHEFPDQIDAVNRAIVDAEERGFCGPNILGSGKSFIVQTVTSPGGYICGEQTALIEAIENHRGEPRNRPPELTTQGLWGQPTLINNVETFSWIPSILLRGPEWYLQPKNVGKRFTSISGDLNRPGVYEVPLGITIGELIELAGGMKDGKELLAFGPSGPSGGLLPTYIEKEHLGRNYVKKMPPEARGVKLVDLPLDNGTFRELGFAFGAAHIVIGAGADLLDQAVNWTEFYRNESCGKCVPCRVGSQKLVQIGQDLAKGEGERSLVAQLGKAMEEASICGLGQVASKPLQSVLNFFPESIPGGWETVHDMGG